MSDNHPLLTGTKGAALILEAAAAEGIPTPRHLNIYAAGHAGFQLASPEEVQEWATWQEGPRGTVTVTRAQVDTEAVFHDYVGTMFDQPFRCYAVTYDAAERFPADDACPCLPGAPEHEHGTGGYAATDAEVSA